MKNGSFLHLVTAFALALISIPASAWNFTYKGLYYTYESSTRTLCFVDKNYDKKFPMPSGDVVIPSKVFDGEDSVTVVAIGSYGFSDCPDLRSVTIAPTIARVWEYAFANSGLEEITIPPTVTTLGASLFNGCTRLRDVFFPDNMLQLPAYAFENSSIAHIDLPPNLVTIGTYAFHKCYHLKDISIPSKVESIGEKAFWHCDSLTDITIEDATDEATPALWCSDYPFENDPITNVYIGRNVGGYHSPLYGFINEDALKHITIGSNVTTIPEFRYCDKIETVEAKGETPFVFAQNIFSEEAYLNATLIVPAGTKDAYSAVEGWKYFGTIKEQSPTGINNISSDEKGKLQYYSVDGRMLQKPEKGINIIKYSNGKTKKVLKKIQ